MKYKLLLTGVLFFSCFYSYCQTDVLFVPAGINLPSDSITRTELLGSLRGWLGQKKGPDGENAFMAPDNLSATSVFMDEIRGMDRRVRPNDTSFYKCYLTNVAPIDSSSFQVQFAYMGQHKETPELRACCTVLARKKGDKFYFSSSLLRNTAGWKTRQIGNCLFHYRSELDLNKASEYQKKVAFYDKKLTTAPQTIDYYCCDNVVEALDVMGVGYKSDYNGVAHSEFSGFAENHTVVVSGDQWSNGFNKWDPHDTWHARLYYIVHSTTINRPVDEACAYLYGGSWRVYTPSDVLRLFREYAKAHPDADWAALYKEGTDFIPRPTNLKISYAINALIVQQLEKEKGFPAVLELLNCGKKEQGDANYFAAVRRLTGVDEAGYNAYVWKLVGERN